MSNSVVFTLNLVALVFVLGLIGQTVGNAV